MITVKQERVDSPTATVMNNAAPQVDPNTTIQRIVEEIDLVIELRALSTDVVRFGVSEASIRVACSAWKKKLNNPNLRGFIEGVPHPTVEFPKDDDPEALRILFFIAHLQFKKVPKELNYKTLAELAKLCEAYDTKDMVHNYIEKWLQSAKDAAGGLDKVPIEQPMWVGWAFD